MEEFLNYTILDNPVQSWLIVLAIVAGSIIAAKLFYLFSTKLLKRLVEKVKLLHTILDMIEEPLAVVMVIGGIYYSERMLVFPKEVDVIFDHIMVFLAIIVATWALARLINSIIDIYIVPIVEASETKLDDQILPIARKIIIALVWVTGILIAISYTGYNVNTILAGLGIGGLAFAFAAQDTIANLFGGLAIFIDAPFMIDDYVKISGFEGTVRDIGLRTSKLETLDGRRLTIPNSHFSKNIIENVSSEPATRVVENIRLDSQTPAPAVEKALELMKQVIAEDPDVNAEKSTAYFNDFGESFLTLTLIFWIKKGSPFFDTRSRVNLKLLAKLGEAGIRVATPARHILTEQAR